MIKQETPSITPIQLLVTFLVCGVILSGTWWAWWNSVGPFQPHRSKVQYTEENLFEDIHYIGVYINFVPFSDYDATSYWSGVAAQTKKDEVSKKDTFTDISWRPTVFKPRIPFPGQAREYMDYDAAYGYIDQAIDNILLARRLKRISDLQPKSDYGKVMISECGTVSINIKTENQRDHMLFRVSSQYQQYISVKNRSQLVPITMFNSETPVYITKEENAIMSIKTVVRKQVNEMLTRVSHVGAQSDHALDAR